MMPATLERLRAEHDNLERLVKLLDACHPTSIETGAKPVEVLVDTLYYLTRYPDVSHHPLEDRIVERLQKNGRLPPGLGEEIEAQHLTLARQGADLMRDLESAAREETMSWLLLETNLRLYAERLRHNMAVEELALFPTAQRYLDTADWRAIEEAVPHPGRDPLFAKEVGARFAQLHRVIAAEADCGCADASPSP